MSITRHILCKGQHDWNRGETVLEETMQLGTCVRLVLRRVPATPAFPRQLTSAARPAASCCAVHHGASHPPTLYPAPSDCLPPCSEKQKKSLSLKTGSEEGRD